MLQSQGNALQEAGMEIPVEIGVPFWAHLAWIPRAPVSHLAVVNPAVPWGNRIFLGAVITATHPQLSDRGLQERRG